VRGDCGSRAGAVVLLACAALGVVREPRLEQRGAVHASQCALPVPGGLPSSLRGPGRELLSAAFARGSVLQAAAARVERRRSFGANRVCRALCSVLSRRCGHAAAAFWDFGRGADCQADMPATAALAEGGSCGAWATVAHVQLA
jgi:hypothetical protein